jgi:hypothetical protein
MKPTIHFFWRCSCWTWGVESARLFSGSGGWFVYFLWHCQRKSPSQLADMVQWCPMIGGSWGSCISLSSQTGNKTWSFCIFCLQEEESVDMSRSYSGPTTVDVCAWAAKITVAVSENEEVILKAITYYF